MTGSVGGKPPAGVGQEALLDFQMAVTLDGEPLTESEIRDLLNKTEGLALVRGRWVEVDSERMRRMIERFKEIEHSAEVNGLAFGEAMRLLTGANAETAETRDEQPIEAPEVTLPEGTVFKIKSDSGSFSFLPEKRTVNDKTLLFIHNQVSLSGNYKLFAGDSVCSGYSFNYDRKESQMSFLSDKGLDSLCTNAGIKNFNVIASTTENLSSLLGEVNRGKFYWKYCIILALLFLAIEELLLRLWKE